MNNIAVYGRLNAYFLKRYDTLKKEGPALKPIPLPINYYKKSSYLTIRTTMRSPFFFSTVTI